MAYPYKNLTATQNAASGLADYILLCPVEDFDVDGIKCPEAPFANPGDEVRVKVQHVLKAGKGFAKYLCSPQKNQLTAKTVGELGSQKLELEAKFFLPGSYAEQHEFVKNALNTPFIGLLKDSNCEANMHYQLGCDCVYAYIKVDFTTGTTKDGVKGYDGTISYSNGYVQLYTAPVTPLLLP